MKFILRYALLAVVLLQAVPQPVGAYSYGDPNQEVIAEAMKELIAKLPSGAPDWAAAGEIYKVHRPEIESHFGASVAATLDADIEAQDRERFLSNYKAVLALNLERRFEYANKDVADYSQAKLLLAKAKGTYDVLQPYVSDDATDAAVRKAFDEALTALGNPGLFGVGEEPVDPDTFKAKTDFILSKIKPLFSLQAAPAEPPAEEQPAKQEPAEAEPAKTEPAEAEPAKPAEQTQAEAPEKTAPEEAAAAEDSPAAEQPTAEAPEAEPSAEPAPTDTDPPTAEETAAPGETAAVETSGAEPAAATVETAAQGEPAPEPAAETSVHAPMERQDRTNPVVSIAVIGAVALAAAGGIWYAKKRKLF